MHTIWPALRIRHGVARGSLGLRACVRSLARFYAGLEPALILSSLLFYPVHRERGPPGARGSCGAVCLTPPPALRSTMRIVFPCSDLLAESSDR